MSKQRQKADDRKAALASVPKPDFAKAFKDVPVRMGVLPKLRFGKQKTDEVRHVVRFLEPAPRGLVFLDRYNGDEPTPGYAITLLLLDSQDRDSSGKWRNAELRYAVGVPHSLAMRAAKEGTTLHGLTAGLHALWDAHKGDLTGTTAVLMTENYDHPERGPTRGYRIWETAWPPPKGSGIETPQSPSENLEQEDPATEDLPEP